MKALVWYLTVGIPISSNSGSVSSLFSFGVAAPFLAAAGLNFDLAGFDLLGMAFLGVTVTADLRFFAGGC